MGQRRKNYIIPIFIPHVGCQHQCVFCNQHKITGANRDSYPPFTVIEETIERHLSTIPSDYARVEIAYYGGSFTALPHEIQCELLEPAKGAVAKGKVDGIRVSTRPDCLSLPTIVTLQKYGVDTVELGVQSFSEFVLYQSQRGHKPWHVIESVHRLRQCGMKIGIQLMLGLPGEKVQDIQKTVQRTIQLKPDFVRIYPVLVLSGTELADQYLKGIYQPLSLDQAVELTKSMVLSFRDADIPVIRIGLQATEELADGTTVLAGPYHPAFRHLVESSIYRDKLIQQLSNEPNNHWTITVHPQDISNVRGLGNSNIKFVEQYLDVRIIKVIQDERLSRGELISTPYLR